MGGRGKHNFLSGGAFRKAKYEKLRRRKKKRRKRGRGKIPSHQPPFLFARPSVPFGARSAPSVPFKKGSDLVKQTHQYQTFRFFPDQFGGALRRFIRQNGVSARFARGQAQVRNPLRFLVFVLP